MIRRLVRERPEIAVAAALFVVLVATSGKYGWHRDELYFVIAGEHPDWGYPDQPPLTPLLAAAAYHLSSGSLVGVRSVAALAEALTVLVVGDLVGGFGGTSRARAIGAAVWAVSGVSLVAGHILETTTFDVLATTAAVACLVRAVARAQPRWMLAAGAVVGVGLLDKLLVGMVMAIVVATMLVVGPRSALLNRWALGGSALAGLGALPYVLWQSAHGWPQLALSRSIAASGAEGGRVGVLPFQLILISVFLAPVWISGLVALLRDDRWRFLPLSYLVLLVAIILTGGKAYYAAGLLTVMAAGGAVATDRWIRRGASRHRALRAPLVAIALGLSLAVNAALGLAILPPPVMQASGLERINPDAGEQVGWPRFLAAIHTAVLHAPADERRRAVVFTGNYGEAASIDLLGQPALPRAYSGHNAFALWSRPTSTGPVVVVGIDPGTDTTSSFDDCHVVSTVNNGVGLNNDEQGGPVQLCAGVKESWAAQWARLEHFN